MSEQQPQYSRQRIMTSDQHPLQARFYTSAREVRGGVFIVPAMGVTQQFYQSFAHWLAEQGWLVATFDYRGMGESRYGSLKGFNATIDLWIQDASTVLAELVRQLDGKPLIWFGHSLGGQIIPLVEGYAQADKIITVAAGNGYWKYNAPALKYKSLLLWHGIVPVTLFLLGYFPGKRLGMVGDLPEGVIREWREYCLQPNYMVTTDRIAKYDAVTQPFTSIYFSDDDMLSVSSFKSLLEFYRHAEQHPMLIHPHDVGLTRIGHVGFFRKEMKTALWEGVLKRML